MFGCQQDERIFLLSPSTIYSAILLFIRHITVIFYLRSIFANATAIVIACIMYLNMFAEIKNLKPEWMLWIS